MFCEWFGKYRHNSTNEWSSPLLIISLENLAPAKIASEPKIRVLPAPVSPVRTLNPSFKSIFKSSIIPIFLICNVVIIISSPKLLFVL